MRTSTTRGERRLRVGFLWHSLTSGNLGVRALTLSQIAMLDAIAARQGLRIEGRLLGNHPGDGARSAVSASRVTVLPGQQPAAIWPWHRMFWQYAREVFSCDLILDIGEGDSFTDIYGRNRYARQVVSRLTALLLLRPLVIGPQTVGPFEAGWKEWLPALILRLSGIVSVRDEVSRACVERLAPRRTVLTATDLAMMLPFERPPARSGGAPRVGLNVSGLLYGQEGSSAGFGIALDYRALIQGLIEAFRARGAEVVIVNHVLGIAGDRDNDLAAAEQIARRYPGIAVAPPFAGPSEAKSFIAGLDFFTGARMHACIAAFSSGTPHVPMAYSRKATGLFDSLGYREVVDLTSETDAGRCIAQILAGFDGRERLRALSEAGMEEARRRLAVFEEALEGRLAGRKAGRVEARA